MRQLQLGEQEACNVHLSCEKRNTKEKKHRRGEIHRLRIDGRHGADVVDGAGLDVQDLQLPVPADANDARQTGQLHGREGDGRHVGSVVVEEVHECNGAACQLLLLLLLRSTVDLDQDLAPAHARQQPQHLACAEAGAQPRRVARPGEWLATYAWALQGRDGGGHGEQAG